MGRGNGKPRLGVIGFRPNYYQDGIWRKLAASDDLDITVVYLSDAGLKSDFVHPMFGKIDLADQIDLDAYPHRFVKNFGSATLPFPLVRINPGIVAVALEERFDAWLIPGHKTLTGLALTLGCIATGTPIIYRAEAVDDHNAASWPRKAMRLVDRAILSRVDIVLYSCTGNRNYFEARGVGSERLMLIPCAVDNAYYRAENDRWRPRREQTRAELDVPDDGLVVSCVSGLEPRKRIEDVVGAAVTMRRRAPELHARTRWVIVGDGISRPEIEAMIRREELENVTLVGYQDQRHIGKWLAASDVGVHLSELDFSPKALNEMLNFGLPIVATEPIGTAFDLVRPYVNGHVVPVGDVEGVVDAIVRMAEGRHLRAYGQASSRIAARWSIDADVDVIRQAVHHVLEARRS